MEKARRCLQHRILYVDLPYSGGVVRAFDVFSNYLLIGHNEIEEWYWIKWKE